MPSARRVARASVRIARERGLTQLAACQAVSDATRAAQWVLASCGVNDVGWLLDIETEVTNLAYPHRLVFPHAGGDAASYERNAP